MKTYRKIAICCLTVVTFLAFATTAYAAGGHRRHYQQAVRSCAFMDDDKDGYCDNWGTNCLFVDTNDDKICDNRPVSCTGYLDQDKDGVCDGCGRVKNAAGWYHGVKKSHGHHGHRNSQHGCRW